MENLTQTDPKKDQCKTQFNHVHQHGENCGHKAINHDDHIDYEHDGHFHRVHGDHVDECTGPKQ